MQTTSRYFTPLLATLAFCSVHRAENVDLSTVPQRNTVQLTIYNSEDLTLVRETRDRDVQEGHQPAAVLLGQHADRSVIASS